MEQVKTIVLSCTNLVFLVLSILATPIQKILDATWGLVEETAKDIFSTQFDSTKFSAFRLKTEKTAPGWLTCEQAPMGCVLGYESNVPGNPYIVGQLFRTIEYQIMAYANEIGFVIQREHYTRLSEIAPHLISKFLIDNNVQGAAIYETPSAIGATPLSQVIKTMTPGMTPSDSLTDAQILEKAGLTPAVEKQLATAGVGTAVTPTS